MPIQSFRCKDTRDVFKGNRCRRFVNIETVAMRKLAMLNRAAVLEDLRIPSGNRLERLKGDRAVHHSIRINEQYRLTFRWEHGHAYEACVEDYH